MTQTLTLADVVAYHVAEAERYAEMATSWARSAEGLKDLPGQTNAVRVARFVAAAQLSAAIAARHAEIADILETLSPSAADAA
jgi:hypothetical protein